MKTNQLKKLFKILTSNLDTIKLIVLRKYFCMINYTLIKLWNVTFDLKKLKKEKIFKI